MSGFQSNDFNEAGMLDREDKQEWQPSLVVASFNFAMYYKLFVTGNVYKRFEEDVMIEFY